MALVPYCKICKSQHWPREPHVWPDAPKPKRVANKTPLANNVANSPNVANRKPAPVKRMANRKTVANKAQGGSTYRYRDPEKRRAYMRELMRKRRAKKSALPNPAA